MRSNTPATKAADDNAIIQKTVLATCSGDASAWFMGLGPVVIFFPRPHASRDAFSVKVEPAPACLRFECVDVRDDTPDGILVGKPTRHGAHQPSLNIFGIVAADAGLEFSEFRREIPIIDAGEPRGFHVVDTLTRVAVARRTDRAKPLLTGVHITLKRSSVSHLRQAFHISRNGLDVVIRSKTQRHRPHAHTFDIAELHSARATPEFP